jgi:3-oxoacyl-[acyl-carrier protein] reductase
MNLELADKPVIVCASSAGLGEATALQFAREGAQVMLCGRREAELQRAAVGIKATTGRDPCYTVADVTKPEDIVRLIEATVSAFGGIFALARSS